MDGSMLAARREALKTAFSVRASYHPGERKQVILDLRRWHKHAEQSLGEALSASTVEKMIDEAFSRYHDWLSDKHSPNFKTIFNDRLDPKTIRRLLTCELSFRQLRRFHDSTIRLVDGFLQVMRHDPLPYFEFGDGNSRDPAPP